MNPHFSILTLLGMTASVALAAAALVDPKSSWHAVFLAAWRQREWLEEIVPVYVVMAVPRQVPAPLPQPDPTAAAPTLRR